MLNSKLKSKNLENIDLIAVKHKDDNFKCPEGFRMAPDLTRYCYDVIPELPKKRPLPLIGDILNSAYQFSGSDVDYIIYTNIDIGLFPDFYDRVNQILEEHEYDFITINREVMPKTIDDKIIDQYNYEKLFDIEGSWHPGTDCFIVKRALLEKANFGNIYIGSPPVAGVIIHEIRRLSGDTRYMANPAKIDVETSKFRRIVSGNRFTFHIGNDVARNRLDVHCKYNCMEAIRLGKECIVWPKKMITRWKAELEKHKKQ
jgi:hypothetical protein